MPGSGLVGDAIGDHGHHGGDEQAVYAYAREELDDWERRLGRELRNGMFGENLTTRGLVVSDAVIGERWRIGDVVLQVTGPRIPCGTFRDHMAEKGWLKTFAVTARSGAYLTVVAPGTVRAGDEVTVVHRPDHNVTSRLAFRALTRERELLPELLAAGDDLPKSCARWPGPVRPTTSPEPASVRPASATGHRTYARSRHPDMSGVATESSSATTDADMSES